MRSLVVIVVLAAAAAAVWGWAWLGRRPTVLPEPVPVPGADIARPFNEQPPLAGRPARLPPPAAPARMRKCLRGAEVLYTDGNCPSGSVEKTVERGSLNVLPAVKPPRPPAASAGVPTIRDDLLGREGGDLKAQQIERALQR